MRLVVRLMYAPRTTLRQIFHLGLRSSRFAQRVVGVISRMRARRIYTLWLHKKHSLHTDAKKALNALQKRTVPPRLSVVVPIYKSNPKWLREAIDSVVTQSYPHWELCLVDDASCDAAISALIKDYTARDARIRSLARSTNGHISAATNDGIHMATGDWVVLLDHDDRLHQHALLLLAEEIDANPESALIYSDEDHMSKTGDRCLPFFKPDWSPHLALSQAYVGHLLCFRRSHKALLREAFDGAQDYDLWLRLSQGVDRNHVRHIPKVLYHWRMHEGSTAGNAESKRYAHESGKRAVQDAVDHRYAGFGVVVEDGPGLFTYKLNIPIPKDSRVSIIIPTRDKLQFLAPCIESIRSRSSWQDFEILIVDNQSSREDTRAYLQHLSSTDPRVRIIPADIPFNWSRLNNLAAQQAQGDALIFLNNDTEILAPGWIESLVGFSRLPDVGCVGGLLLYPDHSIQHNGVVVGLGGWADHIYKGMTPVHAGGGPFVSPGLTRNVLAVTGACLAISKERFFTCGMFDEEFQICGSDVELGIRLYKQGYFNVVVHDAQLLHHESKTRSNVVPEGDFIASAAKYAPYRVDRVDPFYNPNLSLFSTTPNLVCA